MPVRYKVRSTTSCPTLKEEKFPCDQGKLACVYLFTMLSSAIFRSSSDFLPTLMNLQGSCFALAEQTREHACRESTRFPIIRETLITNLHHGWR